MKIKQGIKTIVFLAIFLILFYEANEVLKRKTLGGAWNFSIKTGGFYNLEENSLDYIAVGSSHCYCSINPLVVWEESGLKGYVLSSQQQPVKASYYYIKEALKTQRPKVVILESYMAGINMENPEEGVVRDAYEYLKPSLNRMEMVHELAPEENKMEYYIDFIKYHSRWNEVTIDDFKKDYKKKIDDYRGYVFLTESAEQEKTELKPTDEIKFIEGENLIYMEKIVELSRKYDFRLVLYYAPYIGDETVLAAVNGVREFAEENNLVFLNGFEMLDKLDFKTDFYDKGHVNYRGAEKDSMYLAEQMKGYFEKRQKDSSWSESLEVYKRSVEASKEE